MEGSWQRKKLEETSPGHENGNDTQTWIALLAWCSPCLATVAWMSQQQFTMRDCPATFFWAPVLQIQCLGSGDLRSAHLPCSWFTSQTWCWLHWSGPVLQIVLSQPQSKSVLGWLTEKEPYSTESPLFLPHQSLVSGFCFVFPFQRQFRICFWDLGPYAMAAGYTKISCNLLLDPLFTWNWLSLINAMPSLATNQLEK